MVGGRWRGAHGRLDVSECFSMGPSSFNEAKTPVHQHVLSGRSLPKWNLPLAKNDIAAPSAEGGLPRCKSAATRRSSPQKKRLTFNPVCLLKCEVG
jgi:hypothetical protein